MAECSGNYRVWIHFKTRMWHDKNIQSIHVFGDETRNNIVNVDIANDEQNKLAEYIKESKTKTKPQNNSNFLKK